MKYLGSKRRIWKHIGSIMLSYRKEKQPWIEPFVGGGNSIQFVDGARLGADINRWAIEGLISIRDNVNDLPKNNKEFTEEDYKALWDEDHDLYMYPYKGYAGFAFSYGGKWRGGWARGGNRDYVREAYDNAVKQSPLLKGVLLWHFNYQELHKSIPPESLIYCDPPYNQTTKYSNKDKFNHAMFWNWCLARALDGHTVFVSEYTAPEDSRIECLWEGKIASSITKQTGSKYGTEKLFKVNG